MEEGKKAPDFTAIDQDGKNIKLSSFKGKKNVVLYFYPRDMTPGCTTQACDFRDHFEKFKNTVILGVSASFLLTGGCTFTLPHVMRLRWEPVLKFSASKAMSLQIFS